MSAKIGSLTEAIVAASAGTGSCLPNSSMTKGLFRDAASAARAEIQLFTKTLGSTPKVVLACTKEAWKLSGWHTNGITHQLDAVLSEQHVKFLFWISEQHVKTLVWAGAKHQLQQYPCKDSRHLVTGSSIPPSCLSKCVWQQSQCWVVCGSPGSSDQPSQPICTPQAISIFTPLRYSHAQDLSVLS